MPFTPIEDDQNNGTSPNQQLADLLRNGWSTHNIVSIKRIKPSQGKTGGWQAEYE